MERAALREATLRETASTLAGFQQDLAEACTIIRSRCSSLVVQQQDFKEQLRSREKEKVDLERKMESFQLRSEDIGRAATGRERRTRRELEAARNQMQAMISEHAKERDSHIKAQTVMRKSLEVSSHFLSFLLFLRVF